ncbi:PREDICTED: FMRFamide-related peptides-like [Papilio xuthus]|uniref:FMRFamide-related peptides-like n=1 Tax=Papilio xuthus TaxID=66420 RepID=A0AAJ6ZFL4_PAPXU|nr:PREDICTED: FMRFamide-related peptides-like [Papilio xuthus]
MAWSKSITLLLVCLLSIVLCNPVRRSPDLEARRRSADRNMIRFGRSYPHEATAAEIRESLQRPTRRGNSFLRFGRSQPLTFTTDDLISLLRSYEEDNDSPAKRVSNFVRLGRDPKFIRLGRSVDDEKTYEQNTDLYVNGNPQRKNRARDSFVRLGRDSEDVIETEEVLDERRKRSVEGDDCHS